ncbi:MAG: tripartite tricarboxylate transporter TctB family protein [Deltaproteobacteria bacterium]|nr:tripartite tricarboxylate transporter TctB family protein [Deltaproteobacteria bacterium]
MRNPDQWSSLFWFLAGLGIMLGSLKYGFGTLQAPGAGFITFFAGAVLSLLSVALFLSSLKSERVRKGVGVLWEGLEVGKVIYVLFLLVAYTLILKHLGFLISTFGLLCLLFRVKATYHLMKVILMSLLITSGAYLLFQVWLKVQLPRGILEGII